MSGASSGNKMNRKSNKSANGRFDVTSKGKEIHCRMVQVIKCNTLGWFGHLGRIK